MDSGNGYNYNFGELETAAYAHMKFHKEKPEQPQEYDCWIEGAENPETAKVYVWLEGKKVLFDIAPELFCELCGAEMRDLCICEPNIGEGEI